MFYQVTDNIAADCDAYDRYIASMEEQPAEHCAHCEAEDCLYDLKGERVCVDCLKAQYTHELGYKLVDAEWKDFVRWYYPDSDIDEYLASDIWFSILRPRIEVGIKWNPFFVGAKNPSEYTLWMMQEYCLQDESGWADWLNKNT